MQMAVDHELNRDIDTDRGGIFGCIWRHKFSIAKVSLIVTAITFMVLQVISPRYLSEARILIRAGNAVLSGPSISGSQVQASSDGPDIASQVQLLKSRTIAQGVVDAFDLKDRAEFDTAKNSGPLDRMLGSLGLRAGGRAVAAQERVLESYFDRLDVFQAERARVIVVQFWSHDPELAAGISNRITDEYLALQEVMKRGANHAELDKLKPELKALRTSVMEAESAVAEFRESSDLLQGRDNSRLVTQELSELSTELGQVRAETRKFEQNLQREADVTRDRERDLVQRRKVLKSEAVRVDKAQVELRVLEREADAQRQLLNAHLVRFKEAQARQDREFLAADAYVFSRAQVQSTAHFPKKIPILSAAFLGSMLFAAMITFTGSILSGSAAQRASRDEFEASHAAQMEPAERPKQVVEAVPPPVTVDEPKPVASQPTSNIASLESARMVRRGAVNPSIAAQKICTLGRSRIAVISPDAVGSGPVTAELARSIADSGYSVVVLDMTGRGCSSIQMLGHNRSLGIKDLMAGHAGFSDTIHRDVVSSVHIMPVGTASVESAANSVQQLPAILDAMQATYHYLIIDCGDASTDGLARISDHDTYTVVATMNAQGPDIARTRDRVEKAGFGEALVVEQDRYDNTQLSAIAV